MFKRFRTVVWVLGAVLLLGGGAFWLKQQRASQGAAATTAAPTVAKQPGALELGAVDLVRVSSVVLSRTVSVTGTLRSSHSVFVKAKVPGEIKSLTVREGDPVQAGQVIGSIDAVELDLRLQQAQQQAQAAKSQLDIATRALQNNRSLVEQGFISPTALETTVANEASARANLGASEAAIALARKSRNDAVLVSPTRGTVAQRLAQAGERVGVDARIVEVVDLSRMEVEVAVPPQDAGPLAVGQTAQLFVEGVAQPLMAQVARINPTAQPGSRAVLVYLSVQPPKTDQTLRQGLFARGHITLQRQTVLAVPVSAIRNDQEKPTLLTLVNDRVVGQAVTLGATGQVGLASHADELWVQVKGLAEGQVVLAASAGSLRDGTAVKLPQGQPLPEAKKP
jgi:membrane fusion protein, multidrug efflux system